MTEVKDVWVIKSIQLVRETVCFSEPVTKEDAQKIYEDGEEEDVIDTEQLQLQMIVGVY